MATSIRYKAPSFYRSYYLIPQATESRRIVEGRVAQPLLEIDLQVQAGLSLGEFAHAG